MNWIFSIRYVSAGVRNCRYAVVGPAQSSTVERTLHLAGVPETVRAEVRADGTVRMFVEGALDPGGTVIMSGSQDGRGSSASDLYTR